MMEFLGGVIMMAGGGMVSRYGFTLARHDGRRPAGAIGAALDQVYPASAAPTPPDLAALLDQIP